MGALSDCVLKQGGVLVDYIGDQLIAMWGAPQEQPNHAELACRAALDMLAALGPLNEAWKDKLPRKEGVPESIDLGIGINTGSAWVGNMGSKHKFKYGPLGPTVNLASRVEGATKYLRARLLITEHTQGQLGQDFATRRLTKVRVVGIPQDVDLYELVADRAPAWVNLKKRYEEALAVYEKGDCREAARQLGALSGDDGPALVMCYRAMHHLVAVERGLEFDPVWELPGK
jgi:adenylate cyclase